jgi:CRISPR-associated endoribonuclease Cas6
VRIHIKTSPGTRELPFNYQPILTGAIHKWLDRNEMHDTISLYSFSWLNGGEAKNTGLMFRSGANFFISSYEPDFLKKIVLGIQADPLIANGLAVCEIVIQDDPEFSNEEKFYCASPVFVKRRDDEREIHFTFSDEESNKHLTETLRTKLKKAGIEDNGISVEFDKTYHSPKTKVVYYNKIGNRVNLCPVIIKGSPQQISFAWNVGVGNSTGIGFGALRL